MAGPTQGITQVSSTQAGTQKRTSIEDFINDFFAKNNAVGALSVDEVNPKVVTSVRSYFRQLVDDKRRGKVFDYVILVSKSDGGKIIEKFSVTWLNLLRLVENQTELLRAAALKLMLKCLVNYHVSVQPFMSVYRVFVGELSKSESTTILELLGDVQDKLKENNEITQRWKDCVLALVSYVCKTTQLNVNGTAVNGREYCGNTIYEWLGHSANHYGFGHVVSIAKDAGLFHIVDTYLSDRLLENIANEDQRSELSWKAVCLLNHVDAKMRDRIVRALCTVWHVPAEKPSDDLLPAARLMSAVCADNPAVAKLFSNLFKNERGMVLSSEFGFLSMIALCGIERCKSAMLQEMKRSIHKLWRFDNERSDNGWLTGTNIEATVDCVRKQTSCLIDRLDDPESWKIFGTPLIHLAQLLLECTPSKEIMIVEGRVADGCPLWIFSKDVMTKSLMMRPKEIPDHLMHIVHAISSAGASSSALVFIDVLVEILKKCALEVLNNWKLLNGLFEYVCKMRRDVAVSLIRCLLPVINNRSQLRETLFKTLKKDLLNDSTMTSAVPILLLLLRSVSQRRAAALSQGSMSQSFATFSTQALDAMGLKSSADDTISLEVIGILKRCLSQPSNTRAALYQGMSEAAARGSSMMIPCLDLLLTHASSVPEWTPEDMVISTKTLTQLKEPMPQLVQALEFLATETMAVRESDPLGTETTDDLLSRTSKLITSWVVKAASEDIHDLGVDKLSEWNPTSSAGRANMVFAHMMLSLYDTLIEHLWKQLVSMRRDEDKDYLIALMKRRRELNEVLLEKTVRRKESKVGTATEGNAVDIHQGDVFTSARTIDEIFERLVPGDNITADFGALRSDLMSWCVERAHILSQDLVRTSHPLHSLISSAKCLTSIAKNVLDFYMGVECAVWLRDIENDDNMKTLALETYSNIVRYLATKYHCQPARVISIWQRDPLDGSTSSCGAGRRGNGVNGSLVRHVHHIMSQMYPAVLQLDRREVGSQKKKSGPELEKQSRAMIKISESLLSITTNSKAYNRVHQVLMNILEKNTFGSNAVLRELLKFVASVAFKCPDGNNTVSRSMNTMADDLISILSEEGDEQTFNFITRSSEGPATEFLCTSTERLLTSVRSVITFANEFFVKDNKLDELVCCVLVKCDECCDIVGRLIQLHTQYHIHKERIVQLLAAFFSALEAPVEMLLNNSKTVPKIVEWTCVTNLSMLLKKKVQQIMAVVDENVGCLNPEELMRCNQKRRVTKSRLDENIYVKYVKARESFHSRVLLLCKALKDDRLNLMIKNNSIGLRDFRINVGVLTEQITLASEDDEGSPAPKKRRRTTASPSGTENDETAVTEVDESSRQSDVSEVY